MKPRLTYICRFYNQKPIRVSATCDAQATIIAKAVGAKHGWQLERVGLVI